MRFYILANNLGGNEAKCMSIVMQICSVVVDAGDINALDKCGVLTTSET